ncbi:DUF1444 family protein [Paraburkholderia tropica]|uniref:DUF1444 family protein n=1 Tax=Paraburkholderia tropica TaxID=92647 RepID=UPI003D2BA00A
MGFFDRFRKTPAPPPPPTLAEFAELFMAALRAAGDTRTWRTELAHSRLVQTGLAEGEQPAFINLPNMHRDYADAAPDAREATMRRAVAGMMHQDVPATLAEAKARLRPVIRSATERGYLDLQTHGHAKRPDLAYRTLCENLEIGIACDGEFNVMRLNHAQLATWGVSFDEALAFAIDNLRETSSTPWLALQNGVFLSQFGDFYDASRLLLTDLLYRQSISGAPVVMAPNRAVLLLTGDRNEAGLQTLVELAEQAYAQSRPLPPLMLRWNGEAWERFVPPALAARLHRMRLRERDADYQDQQDALVALHAREGRDVFVAKHTVLQSADGEQRSVCAWSEGVHALLPDTDFFVLVRAATKQTAFVPRAVVMARFADHLKPTSYLPVRHEVVSFPDQTEFEEMLASYEKLPSGG